ncbi:hypothetical protein OSSY52_14970 [Tepiditoga spiralis]|uniref:Uncharacterized protein n=2 Tax=Tepiditoga spiralis TaxID=2108365 RepID=A0A7G1G7L3_9BACT|nr:hypothetical protein OSSY52_14970 [Tepiditoga spiralis]
MLISVLINGLAIILAFYIIKIYTLNNKELPMFLKYFGNYLIAGSFLILFYIYGHKKMNTVHFLSFLILLVYYIRQFNVTRKKFHENFRSMVMSFGYTRKTYFKSFLSKKLIKSGIESFFYANAMYILFQTLSKNIYEELNGIKLIIIFLLLILASYIDSFNEEKIYKNVK